MIYRKWSALLLALGIATASLILPLSVWASANLTFSGNGSVTTGQTWTVTVYVNSDQAVNGVDTIISFPANILEATAIDNSPKFTIEGPGSPSIDNGAGQVRIVRSSLSPHTGNGGKVAAITFKTKAAGTGTLSFGVSKVIAHNGTGDNVYTGGGTATIAVAAPAASTPVPTSAPSTNQSAKATPTPAKTQPQTSTPAPSISSSSHPNQDAWYKDKAIKLDWSAKGVSGYSYVFDQQASTQPPTTINQTNTSLTATADKDGQWYVHLRAQDSNGWSTTAHYRIQIDTQPPTTPVLTIKPDSPMTVRPSIDFSAQDGQSSIASYQLKIDNGQWQEVTSPYQPDKITTGNHTITVKAIDKAGNTSQASASFSVAHLATPSIDQPDKSLTAGNFFKVAGQAPATAKVTIMINGQVSETVEANAQGHYQGQQVHFQLGDYTIQVKATNADGIESPLSDSRHITIGQIQVLGATVPNWVVYSLLVAILLILLGTIIFLVLKLRRSQTATHQTQQVVDQLETLEQKLDGNLDAAGLDPQASQALKQQLSDQIEAIQHQLADTMAKPQLASETAAPVSSSHTLPNLIVQQTKALPAAIKAVLTKLPLPGRPTDPPPPASPDQSNPSESVTAPKSDASPASPDKTAASPSPTAIASAAVTPATTTATTPPADPISAPPSLLSSTPTTPIPATTTSTPNPSDSTQQTTAATVTPAPTPALTAASSPSNPTTDPASTATSSVTPPIPSQPAPPQPIPVQPIAADAFDAVIAAEKQD